MLLLPLAAAEAPPPLVNAEQTDDFAHVVLLRHTTDDGRVAFICTGTLLTPEVILTAAHCLTDVEGYDLPDVRVSSGAVWTDEVPERFAVDWIVHPAYSVSDDGFTIVADLGLVWLDEPYQLDGAVLAAAPVTEDEIGDAFRYVGWGSSSDTVNDQGYYKRVADITLTGLEGEFLLGYDGEDGSATCGGDSGAPVFRVEGGGAGGLVAVHSFARDDDGTICAGSTSGDTQVSAWMDWILAEVPDARTDAPEADPVPKEEADKGGCATVGGPEGLGLLAVLLLRRQAGRRSRAQIGR